MRRRRGIGRIRYKLADRLKELFGVKFHAEDMWVQNPVFARWDLARWGVDAVTKEGRKVNLHSWDTMTSLLKAKKIGIVGDKDHDGLMEVCAD